jgi:hypothetical protein
MNIPLDRLYQYIENLAEEVYGDRVIIYRFLPHGSKNIQDLNNLNDSDQWYEKQIYPPIWCNDQEPLNYEFYKCSLRSPNNKNVAWTTLVNVLNLSVPPVTNLDWAPSVFEKSLLLHSEKRSQNVALYHQDNKLIPVYYWSHAIIAQDWFRFAKHTTFNKNIKKTFLVYNRAWSGTREYRLKFAELLVKLGLENKCMMSINPVEPELEIHYKSHTFSNPAWRPNTVLENFFTTSNAHSHYSADFDIDDYNSTDIEVVLETLFEDNRLHLTEKSLRPIACAQPFILAGTHGSLEYLRGYGFKTFDHIWDEGYDQIKDPEERLIRIVDLMKQIANWDTNTKISKMSQARLIADYNRKHFFSQEFDNVIIDELKTNLTSAFDELKTGNNYTDWVARWTDRLTNYPEAVNFIEQNQDPMAPARETVDKVMEIAVNGCKQE